MPFDLFSDFHLGIGWIDDLLIGLACYYLWQHIKARSQYEKEYSYYQNQGEYSSSWETGGGFNQGASNESNRAQKDPYEILGVDRGATIEEIKRAYHRKAAKYHPDKVSHLGEEFRELAEEKFKEINWAFETLKSGREV